jgi:hypothetical protein
MKPFVFCAAVFLAACHSPKETAAQQPKPQGSNQPAPAAPNAVLVSLETGGCRGYCPIYKLTFKNNGTMEYKGSIHVEKVGEQTVRLAPDEFGRLKSELSKAELWQYPEVIPSTVADAPPHTLTVFEGAKKHSVKTTAGAPKPIAALHDLMKSIAEAHGIMVRKGVDPNDPANMTGELVVKFKPNVNAGNFCMQFMEIKVRPLRRISEDNVWIIGFNPSELTEEQFLDIIRGMEEEVVEAQPNKPVKDRN